MLVIGCADERNPLTLARCRVAVVLHEPLFTLVVVTPERFP